MPPSERALEFLSQLEQQEAKLLCWGFTGGSFSAEELQERAEVHTGGDFSSALRLVEELRRFRLLFQVADGEFRTRMAETVRLLARLKLLRHMDAKRGTWLSAPDLVADYRFSVQPRAWPKRALPAGEVRGILRSENLLDGNREATAQALTENLNLAGFQFRATQRILSKTQELSAKDGETNGTIVCAGTGSGKTLAFYLPALTEISALDGTWTKALAVYPRVELLKDHLKEADRSTDRVTRKIRLGAI